MFHFLKFFPHFHFRMVKLLGVTQAVEKATQGMLQKETEKPKCRTMRNSTKKV